MIGSHNTFSYLPVSKWWMNLLTPWHRCQSVGIIAQIWTYKVRYLDIRIRFVNGEPVFVHNNITYKVLGGVKSFLAWVAAFINCSDNGPVYCRLTLDIRKKPKDADSQAMLFNEFIQWFQSSHISSSIILDEAKIFWKWSDSIIKSKYDIQEVHTSVCSKWYQYILGTRWFAKRHNSNVHAIESENKDSVYLIDFVNLGLKTGGQDNG